jgi:hypothetical protein
VSGVCEGYVLSEGLGFPVNNADLFFSATEHIFPELSVCTGVDVRGSMGACSQAGSSCATCIKNYFTDGDAIACAIRATESDFPSGLHVVEVLITNIRWS